MKLTRIIKVFIIKEILYTKVAVTRSLDAPRGGFKNRWLGLAKKNDPYVCNKSQLNKGVQKTEQNSLFDQTACQQSYQYF